jgi:TRAP-type C4-dicarboxylate transport system substrate-binding protein
MQGFGSDIVASTNTLWDLYESVPEMAAQWDNEYKVLQLYSNPPMMFMFSNKITTADQIKGLNIRCPAGAITDILAAWGGSGITMGPTDIYEAMEKHNIDGYIFEPVGCDSFSLYEVTPYYLDMPLYTGAFSIACNWDSWNALPAEYQEAIEAISTREQSLVSAQAFADAKADAMAKAEAAGVEILTPTDDEIATWAVEADKYAESWCESITASTGVDGAAYLQNAKDIYAKYE